MPPSTRQLSPYGRKSQHGRGISITLHQLRPQTQTTQLHHQETQEGSLQQAGLRPEPQEQVRKGLGNRPALADSQSRAARSLLDFLSLLLPKEQAACSPPGARRAAGPRREQGQLRQSRRQQPQALRLRLPGWRPLVCPPPGSSGPSCLVPCRSAGQPSEQQGQLAQGDRKVNQEWLQDKEQARHPPHSHYTLVSLLAPLRALSLAWVWVQCPLLLGMGPTSTIPRALGGF